MSKNYIQYNGERLNLDEWTTMYNKAKETGHGEAYIRQLVHRTKTGKTRKPIEFRELKEIGLTLVKK